MTDTQTAQSGVSYESLLEDEPFLDVFLQPEPAAPSEPVLPAAPSSLPNSPAGDRHWYLGIDFGTTGISAILLNRATCQLYPLYWASSAEPKFRLPASFSYGAATQLQNFKPYLNLGVPYQAQFSERWEPILQWSDTLQVPLVQLTQALQSLLSILISGGGLGLEEPLPTVLSQLAGVAIGCPAHGSAAYRVNLRQVVLQMGLVHEPQQVYFLEESIAALLSTLPSSNGQALMLPHTQQSPQVNLEGNTLVLSAGASATELMLVQLTAEQPALAADSFHIRSLPFAGDAIDQDIICQLIYPVLKSAPADRAAGEMNWSAIALDPLQMPTVGEPDLAARYLLQQRLRSSPSGQRLLEEARQIKLKLQKQSRYSLNLGNWQPVILRQDLGSQVLLPYIQRLNRELNSLLNQTHLVVTDINQVICTGGTASLGAIARWLRQKLPNATILQDTYPTPIADQCIPGYSRVAYGLAVLPLHSQLLDRTGSDDYTLLLSLLRLLHSQPLPLSEIMRQLGVEGIEHSALRSHIMALLENHLPSGLAPSSAERRLLAPESLENPDYQAILADKLFELQEAQTYRLNLPQADRIQPYLEALMAAAGQAAAQ